MAQSNNDTTNQSQQQQKQPTVAQQQQLQAQQQTGAQIGHAQAQLNAAITNPSSNTVNASISNTGPAPGSMSMGVTLNANQGGSILNAGVNGLNSQASFNGSMNPGQLLMQSTKFQNKEEKSN